VAVERRRLVLKAQIAVAASEKRVEDVPEVAAHLLERLEEHLPGGDVDLPDRLLQRELRVREVVALRLEELEALRLLLVFLDRERVHRPERFDALAQLLGFGPQRVLIGIDSGIVPEQFVERAAPLCLEALANRGAPAGELGMAELRLVPF